MKDDSGDFGAIPTVAAAAVGAMGGEMTFAFPEVLHMIHLCSEHQIAVLGSELFTVRSDGLYQTENLTEYHLHMKNNPHRIEEWPDYVRKNNLLAEEFVRANPAGDDHVYILTTASWREFSKIQEIRRQT